MAPNIKKINTEGSSEEIRFSWMDISSDSFKSWREQNNPNNVSGIVRARRYESKKFFAIVMALLLLIQMQPFSFSFAEDGSDAAKAETTASDEIEKTEPVAESAPEPKAEPKPEPKPEAEPAAEPAATETPAAEQTEPATEDASASEEQVATQDAETAEEQPAEEEKEDEEKYPAQTLTANAGGVTVTLKAPEGALPEGSKLKAKQVGQKYIDAVADTLEEQGRELTDAVAIDVTPVNKDGKEVQPKKAVKVTFSGTGLDLGAEDEVDVWRVSDDASSVTDMGGSGSSNSATFTTSHFTIYVDGGSTTNQNGDGSGANTVSNPLVIPYNDSKLVHSSTNASTWGIVTDGGDAYVTVTPDGPTTTGGTGRTRAYVANINGSDQDQTVQIHHHRTGSSSVEYYWVKALAQRFTVTYKFQDVGAKSFADDGTEEVIKNGAASQQPTHADKTEGGVTYSFDGWYTDEDCTTSAATALGQVTSDITVYGRYKANTVTVTYDPNGGTIDGSTDPKKEEVSPGTSITLIAPDTRTGYTFDGWKTGDDTYNAGASYTVNAAVTFEAQWTPKEYTISYDLDGGTAPDPDNPKKYTVGDDVTIDKEPTKAGYTFEGWTWDGHTSPEKTISWSAGDETGNKTYTANWELEEYDITYDYDGGTAPTTGDNPTTYTVESPVSISNKPTKEGYTFTGWTGDDITTPQETISWSAGAKTGDKEFKANWEANTNTPYTVEFYYQEDGSYPDTPTDTDDRTGTTDTTASVTDGDKTPTKGGYAFDSDAGNVLSGTIAGDGSLKLKVYFKQQFTVKYAPGEQGTWTTEENDGIDYGASTPDPTVDPEDDSSHNPGYEFDGWDPDKAATVTEDATYTAKWKEAVYTITYDLDGGKALGPNPESYTISKDINIRIKPTKEGYTFKGWTGSGITTPQQTISWNAGDETGDKEYKANWDAVEYTITYNYAGGTAPTTGDNPTTYTVEDPVSISNEPTREGYIFTGWTSFDTDPRITDPTTPVEWSAGEQTGNLTFTANWKKQVALRYHKNTGDDQATIIPPEETIVLGVGDVITLATAEYEGHHFEEWNTKEDGTGSHHAGGSEYTMPDHDVDLYAQWTEHPIKVTYYYNYSGTPEPYKEASAPENDPHYQIINEMPTRAEYIFVGWSKTEGATETSQIDYLPGAYMETEEEDIDLYAVWVMNENEEREYIDYLEGFGKEVYYTGREQELDRKFVTDENGNTAWIGISSIDQPQTGHGDYKYAGYVRVGQKTDGDPEWHNVYAYVQITESTKITGTNVGVYNGPTAAPLYAHRQGGGLNDMDRLYTTDSAGNSGPEYIEVKKDQLIIKAVPIVITTNSDKKAHDGRALTAGGTVTIGADDDTQIGKVTADLDPGENPITLRNGETVIIEITGSQTDLGSSKNDVVVHWSDSRSTGEQHNYTVTKNLGTLTVYDFTAEFDKNTTASVSGMPEDWEGDTDDQRQYTLPSNVPTRAHSVFEGWTTNPEGTGTVYLPSGTYTYPDGETDVKFYAKWSQEVDDVTYDPNDGKFNGKTTPTHIGVPYGTNITVGEVDGDVKDATRDYYTFKEWNTEKDGSGTAKGKGSTYLVQGAVTFYAQWTPIEYTIGYDLDEGTAPDPDNPKTYTVEDDVTIDKIPTKTGYTFEGWTWEGHTSPEPTISWSAGAEHGNKSYKANWEAVEYTISYDLDGGTAPDPDNPKTYTVEDDITIDKEPTKEGYTFEGWTGSGVTTPQKTISWKAGDETGNKSYKANWERIQHNVTYDPNGGTYKGSTDPTTTKEDEGATIKIGEEPTREHYIFKGWEDEEGKLHQPGADFTVPNKDATFTAKWEPLPKITYDPNGGTFRDSDEPTSIEYMPGEAVEIAEAATRDHHVFKGWKDSEGVVYQAGDKDIEFSGDVVLTAVWDKEILKLYFNPNGGEFRGSEKTKVIEYEYGDTIRIPEAPVREGYEFLYWEGSRYYPGDSYTVTEEHRFVAQWAVAADAAGSSTTSKKSGGSVYTGDSSSFQYFYILFAAMIMMALVLYNRRRELLLSAASQVKEKVPGKPVSEAIRLSDSCNFRWTM